MLLLQRSNRFGFFYSGTVHSSNALCLIVPSHEVYTNALYIVLPQNACVPPYNPLPSSFGRSDIDSDYVHVSNNIALEVDCANSGGEERGNSSPFVNVRKAPVVVEEGQSASSSTVDMDVVADEEVWSDPAAAGGHAMAVNGSSSSGGDAMAVSSAHGSNSCNTGNSVLVEGSGGDMMAVGEGKRGVFEGMEGLKGKGGQEEEAGVGGGEVLPYRLLVTDYAGTATKGMASEVRV